MKCSCGGELEEASGRRVIQFPGRRVSVNAQFLRCEECGEVLLTPEQAQAARAAASAKIRRREDLLQPSEIRAIRERLGLTQRGFEQLLRVGPKTVARWEAGTVFQSKAVDNLLRVLAEVPDACTYLAQRAGLNPVGTVTASGNRIGSVQAVTLIRFEAGALAGGNVHLAINHPATSEGGNFRSFNPLGGHSRHVYA